jgi:hypothetical protein
VKRTDERIDIGTVVEVPTENGFGYLQFTHRNELMGALVRVLPGVHATRPVDFGPLVASHETYVTFVPLLEAIRAKMFTAVAHAPVPERARNFPLFRAAGPRVKGSSEPTSWWLWDGKEERRLESLSPEQRQLPIWEATMPPVIVPRFNARWKPGDAEPSAPVVEIEDDSRGGEIRHYLYFPTEDGARRAATTLSGDGARVVVDLSARGDEWLVLAYLRGAPDDRGRDLEPTARKFGGTYDGWEG